MNVKSVEKKEKNSAELTVEVSAEEFEAAVNSAYKKNKNNIAIPGFRKGKAPRKLIESMYGASIFYEDAVEILYPQAFEYAVTEEKLNIVGRPSVLDFDISEEKVLTIKYAVDLYPEVTLGEYKGLSAPKAAVKVLKKDVEEEVENVRKRNARIETVERAAKSGDTANIDFEGFLDGKPFDGGKGENYNLVLGSNQFIPGFEEQVVGMSAGEEKDIDVTFPENYTPELAGKAVVFKVKVNEVKESILPELDDEFAKDVSEFDTLDEYKESVKEQISARKKEEAERAFKSAILGKVIDGVECDIPESMIEERINATIENYNYNLAGQGMSFDAYLQMMGMDMASFRENVKPSTVRELKAELALEKIAETENFDVSEEKIEEEYKRISEMYGVEIKEAKQYINQDAVVQQLKIHMAEDAIYDSAVVEKKKAAPKKAKEPEEGKEEADKAE